MKTDRELLELAAKAAGMMFLTEWTERITDYDSEHFGGCALHSKGNQCNSWNPLTDDGDALRLAVELGIEIHPDLEVDEVATAFVIRRDVTVGKNTIETFDGDPTGATRRAIVRAAAEIGEAME